MNIKLDDSLFEQLLAQARINPRKRSHLNLHNELTEPVQRFCIGLTKGTYVRPHHHPDANKWELLLALKGTVALIIFNKDGVVLERLVLGSDNSLYGIEIKPDTWHTLFPLTDEAIVIEIKEGPYTATTDKYFAAWAPAEGEINVTKFLKWLENAMPGDKYIA